MSLEQNLSDMDRAIDALEEMKDKLKDFLSDNGYDRIENVITEFRDHLQPDVENALDKIGELEDKITELQESD